MDKLTPTTAQKDFVTAVSVLVTLLLERWPTQSGRTTARQMLAERILSDDR